MTRLKLLLLWFLRAWPILAVVLIGFLHYFAFRALPAHSILVNKMTGTSMQIVGGLVVLHAINGNLGLFRQHSLSTALLRWVRDFPLRSRNQSVQLSGVSATTAFGYGILTSKRPTSTVDEKLAELERRIEEVQALATKMVDSVNTRVDLLKSELSSEIASGKEDLRRLQSKIEQATVGGFKQQVFGVLLAVYGAVLSVFT